MQTTCGHPCHQNYSHDKLLQSVLKQLMFQVCVQSQNLHLTGIKMCTCNGPCNFTLLYQQLKVTGSICNNNVSNPQAPLFQIAYYNCDLFWNMHWLARWLRVLPVCLTGSTKPTTHHRLLFVTVSCSCCGSLPDGLYV